MTDKGGMSHPRMSVPGGTYLITRTTVMSLFLLVPGKVVNEIMEYCLVWAAHRRGILLHAISVESNHYHAIITDTKGLLSEFVQEFNRCAARCLLEYYRTRFPNRRLDSLWTSSQSFGATLLLNPHAVIDKTVYSLTNPVKDGLVSDYRKWPGFNTRPSDWRGRVRCARRPSFYFKDTPEQLLYQVVPPSQLDCGNLETLIADVESHIRQRQAQFAVDLAAQGRRFMEAKAVQCVNPFESPSTRRPVGDRNPYLAAGGDHAVLETAVKALVAFRTAYRQAWKSFKRGAKAIFPGGTLLMRKRFGVQCDRLDAACFCQLAVT